jgi:hypothetical protein
MEFENPGTSASDNREGSQGLPTSSFLDLCALFARCYDAPREATRTAGLFWTAALINVLSDAKARGR